MMQCRVPCFGPIQNCPTSRNDTTVEMGTNEAQRTGAEGTTHHRNEKKVLLKSAKEHTKGIVSSIGRVLGFVPKTTSEGQTFKIGGGIQNQNGGRGCSTEQTTLLP